MRHVDEGTIHAWLDHQVTDPAEAAWIAEHLRVCAACAARLADERAMLEQADALLAGVARVADTGRPAFDALVSRANASAPAADVIQRSNTRMRTWLIPASWAASVALAFALGWSVREPAVREPAPQQAPRDAALTVARSDARVGSAPASAPTDQPEATKSPASVRDVRRKVSVRSEVVSEGSQKGTGVGHEEVSRAASPLPTQQEIVATAPIADAGFGGLNQVFAPRQGGGQGLGAAPAVPVNVATGIPQPVTPPAPGFVGASSTGSLFSGVPAGAGGGGRGGRGGANQGRILVDGMVVNAGTPADGIIWRTLPRTQAAAWSGMPLYGIDGLTPSSTMLSADNTIVRTVYRLDSGETIDVTQQKVVNPPVVPNAQVTVVAEAPVVDVQNTRATPSTVRPSSPSEWSTERDGVRLTLRGAANLPALGERLRVD
jgi:hypothetical protein